MLNQESSGNELSDQKGVLTFEDILKMSKSQATRIGAGGAWNWAHLWQLIDQMVSSTQEPPAKPPSYFVSYRWESVLHRTWVARLVQSLKSRGYEAVFDQDVQEGRDEPVPVPELISLIGRCNHFLFVLTKGYLQRIETNERGALKDGWVWDEYQVAIRLFELGRVKSFLCVWRSGELPNWLREEQVWDFRDDARYDALVSEAFPIRLANIIGVYADRTTRVVCQIERTRINEVGRGLEATEKFDHFLIEHL